MIVTQEQFAHRKACPQCGHRRVGLRIALGELKVTAQCPRCRASWVVVSSSA